MEFKSIITISLKGKEVAIWLKCENPSKNILISDIVDVVVCEKISPKPIEKCPN